MAAATAYCTSNTSFHQHSLTTPRSQFSPSSRRTTSSPSPSFSSAAPTSHIEQQPTIIKAIQSDENNNEHQIEDTEIPDIDGVLYIASDNDNYDDDDDDNHINHIDVDDQIIDNDIDEEQYLSFVGLRPTMKKPIVSKQTLPPLTKRFACPVCLLPLPKYSERARQALYIRLPFLKFLKTTSDIERYCSTDKNTRAQSLLPRSAAQTRALSAIHKSPRKQKLPRTELINMATNTFRNKTTMCKYIQSILQCNVVLDRLEQSTIDQIMEISIEDDDKCTSITSTTDRSLRSISPKPRHSLASISKSETTVDKRKSITPDINVPKRFKSIENEPTIKNNNRTKNDLTHQRIYLKCFVCSKRQYVNATATNSDILHSHWLEHDGDLSLNIYDSEIDSILTRVVEFFNLPRQHLLEGKIKTVFIYNSKEIRSTSTTTLSSTDSHIVLD